MMEPPSFPIPGLGIMSKRPGWEMGTDTMGGGLTGVPWVMEPTWRDPPDLSCCLRGILEGVVMGCGGGCCVRTEVRGGGGAMLTLGLEGCWVCGGRTEVGYANGGATDAPLVMMEGGG